MSRFAMVVRALALVLGVVCLFAAGFALLTGMVGGAIVAGFWGVSLVAGVLFERWRYKPAVSAAGPEFQPTAERFIDTDTGRPVQVFVDPRSGERRYVES